jgi:hypothetical protein
MVYPIHKLDNIMIVLPGPGTLSKCSSPLNDLPNLDIQQFNTWM